MNDLAMFQQRELLAESNKRRRVLPALRRAIRQFLKRDGDARQLAKELPALIHKVEEQLPKRTGTCSCVSSR